MKRLRRVEEERGLGDVLAPSAGASVRSSGLRTGRARGCRGSGLLEFGVKVNCPVVAQALLCVPLRESSIVTCKTREAPG